VSSSAAFFELAALGGFALRNSPGIYTRFPLPGNAWYSVIDLGFANPLLVPFVNGRDTFVLLIGSEDVPITVLRAAPSRFSARPASDGTTLPGRHSPLSLKI